MLYLRNQYDLLNNVESHMQDTSNYRWSETEIYGALNDAVRSWHGHVTVPAIYVPGTNWPDDVHVIDVPVGIDPESAIIQIRYLPVENSVDQVDTWYDVNGWRTEPTAFGGQLPSTSSRRASTVCFTGLPTAPCPARSRPWAKN